MTGLALATKRKEHTPDDRNVKTEGMATMDALEATLPRQFALEQQYGPQYGQLYADTLGRFIGGFEDASIKANRAGRAADVQDLNELGAGYRSGFQALDPTQMSYLDTLVGDATRGLNETWGPQMRGTQQAVRSAQAARGMGFGPSDIYQEALATSDAGNRMREDARRYALAVAQARNAMFTAPGLQMLGARSSAPGMAFGGMQQLRPGFYADAYNPYAQDVYDSNFNARWGDLLSKRNANAQQLAAGMSADAQVMSSGMGLAGGLCWIAREVYGVEDPRWLLFRDWLVFDAPRWFSFLYWRYGQRFAEWIRNKPRVKEAIRRWMDRRIAGRFLENGQIYSH